MAAYRHGPLRERVVKSSSVSSSTGVSQCHPLRPIQYKGWSHESMKAAMKAVIDDTFLTSDEEEELVSFLCRTASIGHGRTRQEVIAIVERVLSSRGVTKSVSSGWWAAFVGRHPELALRTPATLSLARASASDRYVIDRYFEELESAFEENGLVDKPCLIFNMDETGMPLDPKPLKIVTWKGHKNPSQVSSGLKSQVTVVGCVSAGGQCLPPMVIWDRKNLPPELGLWEKFQELYMVSPARAGLTRSSLTSGSPYTFSAMLLLLVPCCY